MSFYPKPQNKRILFVIYYYMLILYNVAFLKKTRDARLNCHLTICQNLNGTGLRYFRLLKNRRFFGRLLNCHNFSPEFRAAADESHHILCRSPLFFAQEWINKVCQKSRKERETKIDERQGVFYASLIGVLGGGRTTNVGACLTNN